jgi:hypothetical protein
MLGVGDDGQQAPPPPSAVVSVPAEGAVAETQTDPIAPGMTKCEVCNALCAKRQRVWGS